MTEERFKTMSQIAQLLNTYSDREFDDIICDVRELRLRTEQAKEICRAHNFKFMWMNSMYGFAYEKEDEFGATYSAMLSDFNEEEEW